MKSLISLCFGLAAMTGCGTRDPNAVDPPPQGQGFQLKVPPFTVNAGEEVQSCYFFAVPGNAGDDVWVNRYQIAQPPGSHHMNLFRIATIKNLSGKPGDVVINGECFKSPNWSDWPLVVNSQQNSDTDWALPDGVGARFKAGDLLMLQTHWVNATTQKTIGQAEVSVNLWTMKAPPPNELGTLFATNQNIEVCPGDVGRAFTKTCKFPSQGVHIVAANGHFHSRGKDFQMFAVDAQGTVGKQFYESTVWDDPPMTRTAANQSEIASLDVNGGVQWKCTFDFPTEPGACGGGIDPTTMMPNCCYTFGPKVELNEHCNAFVYYWPKVTDANCF